tara:strand:- start:9253 stop:9594 length:342 start_codon:yes stop_codon:yes gene_type:complete
MRTAEEMKAWEIQAYGMTAENLDAELAEQRERMARHGLRQLDPSEDGELAWQSQRLALIASLLSDAQEEMGHPDQLSARGSNRARQKMNVAKRMIFDLRDDMDALNLVGGDHG